MSFLLDTHEHANVAINTIANAFNSDVLIYVNVIHQMYVNNQTLRIINSPNDDCVELLKLLFTITLTLFHPICLLGLRDPGLVSRLSRKCSGPCIHVVWVYSVVCLLL